jgi:glycerophosphoryl diester phosphodiesterase
MEDRVVLQSFDMRTLDALRKINKTIPIVALIEDSKQDMIEIAKDHHVDIISPRYTIIDAATVQKLHAMNVKVVPWTADDETAWKSLVAMKVDGIISDDPESMMAYLNKK